MKAGVWAGQFGLFRAGMPPGRKADGGHGDINAMTTGPPSIEAKSRWLLNGCCGFGSSRALTNHAQGIKWLVDQMLVEEGFES
jgi:hypothetical protein